LFVAAEKSGERRKMGGRQNVKGTSSRLLYKRGLQNGKRDVEKRRKAGCGLLLCV
jgi:hypothetical protein